MTRSGPRSSTALSTRVAQKVSELVRGAVRTSRIPRRERLREPVLPGPVRAGAR